MNINEFKSKLFDTVMDIDNDAKVAVSKDGAFRITTDDGFCASKICDSVNDLGVCGLPNYYFDTGDDAFVVSGRFRDNPSEIQKEIAVVDPGIGTNKIETSQIKARPAVYLRSSLTEPEETQMPETKSIDIVRAIVMGLFSDMTSAEYMLILKSEPLAKRTKARIYKFPKSNEAAVMFQHESGEVCVYVVNLDTGTAWNFNLSENKFHVPFVLIDFG